MLSRLVGVLAMDPAAFRELEKDSGANIQALIVVVVSAILSAIGGGYGGFLLNLDGGGQFSSPRFIVLAVWTVIAWFLWSAVVYLIGTKVFKGQATYGEMVRVIGFAYAPHAFNIFSLIPYIGLVISLLVTVWALGASVVAIYEGLDLEIGQTLAVALLGYFVYLIGLGVILSFVP